VVLPIASITKLMTAMVILDSGVNLEQRVAISDEDYDNLKGTRSRLRPGSVLTRDELLLLALMSSENRAAHALGRSFPGGEHGWMDLSSLAKELANAASALNQGQISDLVETQGDTEDAIWIIQAEEKKPAHVKPLSEVRDQIDKKLKEDEQRRLEIAWIQKLKKKTYIKTF